MFKLFKKFTFKDYIYILLIFVFVLAQVYFDLKIPDYMSEITKLIQTEGSQMSDILHNGIYMVICAFASLLFAIITGYLSATLASNFTQNIRKHVFDKVTGYGIEQIKEFSVSSLITRSTNDITQITMIVAMGITLILKAPITAIWAISKIVGKSTQWSVATALSVGVLLTMIIIIASIVLPRFKKVQELIDKINNLTRENLNGIRVVHAFNAEKFQEDKFNVSNSSLTSLQTSNQKTFSAMMPVMNLVLNGLSLAIYIIGAILIVNANLVDKINIFADMVVYSSYAMQVIMSFLLLAMVVMIFPRAQISANRINEVLEKDSTIKNGTKKEGTQTGTVEFKNVTFKYPDASEELLSNISFKANKGDTVAIIGSTGSGKSTLVNLIPRFYDTTQGEILIDGINVKEYNEEDLNNKIGYISQKPVIFDGTVKENIAYGNPGHEITDQDIEEAIEVAQAKEFVEKLDDGINSHIASAGTNISGGQKQRLSIARAIAKKPEIYVFDDSFSALDYQTDKNLRQALKDYTKDSTQIIVAQRVGTIMNADKIIVLDEGKIVGIGTHKELLKNNKVYQEIAYSQLSKEELEDA